jgi:tRNA(Ile2) C34 agmatinyltransferase TiaS
MGDLLMEKPDCPKCQTNVNIVEYTNYFRCCYCGTEVSKKDKFGETAVQQKLF